MLMSWVVRAGNAVPLGFEVGGFPSCWWSPLRWGEHVVSGWVGVGQVNLTGVEGQKKWSPGSLGIAATDSKLRVRKGKTDGLQQVQVLWQHHLGLFASCVTGRWGVCVYGASLSWNPGGAQNTCQLLWPV